MTFMERFKKCLLEEDEEQCGSMVRVDKLGNRVVIPYGGTLQSGKNGRGVAIPKGSTCKEDHIGQMHAIPPGKVLKIGKNGVGVVVCPSESTTERKGQIVVNQKNAKHENKKSTSCLKLLEWSRIPNNN